MADGGEGILDALGGANRTTTVTGPARRPGRGAAGGSTAGTAVDRDGAGVGPRAGRRRRRQRPDRGVDLRHRRADRRRRRGRGPAGARRRRRLGHDRRRARRAAGPVPARRLRGVELVVACDVRTRFVDAAEVFAPQKGATAGPGASCCAAGSSGWPRCTSRSTASTSASSRAPAPPAAWPAGWPPSAPSCVAGFEVVADEIELWTSASRAPTWSSPARGSSTSRASRARSSAASPSWRPRPGSRSWSSPARCSTTSTAGSRPCRSSSASARSGPRAETAGVHRRGRGRAPAAVTGATWVSASRATKRQSTGESLPHTQRARPMSSADHDQADQEHDGADDDADDPPEHQRDEDAAPDGEAPGEPDRERSSSTPTTLRG